MFFASPMTYLIAIKTIYQTSFICCFDLHSVDKRGIYPIGFISISNMNCVKFDVIKIIKRWKKNRLFVNEIPNIAKNLTKMSAQLVSI